jgi:O-antigen/teichoic acid export membrane protein
MQSLLAQVIGVVYFMFLTRFFPVVNPEAGSPKMGVFQFMNFIVVLSNILGALALPSAAAKYIPQYLAKNEKKKANSVAVRHFQVALITATTISLTVFLSSDLLATTFFGNSEWVPPEQVSVLLKITSLSCFLTNIMSFLSGALLGLKKIGELALINLTFNVLQSFLVIALLFFGFDLFAVPIGWSLGMVVAAMLGAAIVLRNFTLKGKPHPLKPLLSFSLPLYVSAVLTFTINWVDQIFIFSIINPGVFGMYSVIIKAALIPSLIALSIVMAIFPHLSESYAKEGIGSLEAAFSFSTRYAVAIGFPMVVGISLIAQPSLVLFAGASYKPMTPYLVLLAFATIPTILGVAIRPILLTLGRSRTVSLIIMASIVFEALTCYVTIVTLGWGVLGATIGRMLAALANFALGIYVLKKQITLNFDKDVLWKTTVSCGAMAAFLLLLDVFRMQVTGSREFLVFRLHLLPFYIILGTLVYATTLFMLRTIKRTDLELLREYLPGKLRRTVDLVERIFPVNNGED